MHDESKNWFGCCWLHNPFMPYLIVDEGFDTEWLFVGKSQVFMVQIGLKHDHVDYLVI